MRPLALLLVVLELCALLITGVSAEDASAASSEQKKRAAFTSSFRFTDVNVSYTSFDQGKPAACTVLLLHDKGRTSRSWVKSGALEVLAGQGHNVMALDLPGSGRSRALPYLDNNLRAEVLQEAFEVAGGRARRVLVSPSVSGQYATSYLERHGHHLAGWAAVAIKGVAEWGGPTDDVHNQVWLMAAYGQKDPAQVDFQKLSMMFKRAHLELVPEAGKECYMQNPAVFNERLAGFVEGACQRGRAPP